MCTEAGVPDHVDEVIEMARNCLASPTVQRAIASGSYYREVPFTIPLDDGGFAVGRIDLLSRDGDGVVVADYKSDRITGPEIDARMDVYQGQAETYALSMARATGLSVRDVVLVFARPGIERTFDNELGSRGHGSVNPLAEARSHAKL